MIKFKLDPENFNYLNTQYDIIQVDMSNYFDHVDLIKKTIKNFNDEIEWADMFNLQKAMYRFEYGMMMYIGIIDNEPFGHVWFDRSYLFNLFVRNQIENKTYSGKEFVSDVLHKYYNNRIIYCEVDDWNTKSINLFTRLGFRLNSLMED